MYSAFNVIDFCMYLKSFPKCCQFLFHNIMKIQFFFPVPVIKICYLQPSNSVAFLPLSPPLAPWLQFSQVCISCLPFRVRPIPPYSASGVYFPCSILCLELWHDHTLLQCASSIWNKYRFYIHLSFHRCGCNIVKLVYKIVVPWFCNIIWNQNIPICKDLASACTWEIRPCKEYQGLQL